MTDDVLAGRPTAFYPEGRNCQRPATLVPRPNEQPEDVVASFVEASRDLDEAWSQLGNAAWGQSVREPAQNTDLGTMSLAAHALLRLTEVEVHGTDLDINASEWSDTFIDAALPMRLRWLPARRSNHRSVEEGIFGTWVFSSIDGPTLSVKASPEGTVVEDGASTDQNTARIKGTKAGLLAFVLGRRGLDTLSFSGNAELASKFLHAFPPP